MSIDKEVIIRVAGSTASGKSTIALLIQKALTEAGIKSVVTEEYQMEQDSFHTRTQEMQEQCISALKNRDTLCRIETLRLTRHGTWPTCTLPNVGHIRPINCFKRK